MAEKLFYDNYTGRMFWAEEQTIRESMERLNKKISDRIKLSFSDVVEIVNRDLPDNMKINMDPMWELNYENLKKDGPSHEPFTCETVTVKGLPIISINYNLKDV